MNDSLALPKDLSTELSTIQTQFAIKGLSWEHPRVRAWMDKVGERAGRAINSRHDLPDSAIEFLAAKLSAEPHHKPLPVSKREWQAIGSDKGFIGQGTCEYELSVSAEHLRVRIDFHGLDAELVQDWLGLALQMLDDMGRTNNGKTEKLQHAA